MALLNQKRESTIFIIDNHSTDGTYDYLNSRFDLISGKIKYYDTGENIGGAGGFCYGLKLGYSDPQFTHFWLMDDDGRPFNDETLQKLVEEIANNGDDTVLKSLVVSEDGKELTFGLGPYSFRSDINNKTIKGHNNPFNGTLISRKTLDIHGFPRKEYVLGYDEVEYMTRIKTNGGELITVTDSLYYHPKPNFDTMNFLGKTITKPDGNWRYYYRQRNTVDYLKNYKGKASALKFGMKLIIISFLFASPHKFRKTFTAYRAFRDGYRGDFSANKYHLTGVYERIKRNV